MEIAVFGGGCFWCLEAVFKEIKGVQSVMPGYAGGDQDFPNEFEVHSGFTGHAEVLRIEFDPSTISYSDLLDIFWSIHNPTSLNRQGNDIGPEYRSIILYTSESQKDEINKSIKLLKESKKYKEPILTEVAPLDKFYDTEEYHQNYFENHKDEPYCQLMILPKLQKFKEEFKEKVK